MSTQTVRRVLTVLSALVLAAGLAPPPAASAAAPGGLSWPTLAAFPGPPPTAPGSPGSPDGLPTAPPPGSTQDADPTQQVADVYSGFDNPYREEAPEIRSSRPSGASRGPTGVTGQVRATVDADGTAPVIIRLREQADLAEVARQAAQAGQAAAAATARQLQGAPFAAQAARNAARDARGQVVVDALQAAADASQEGVRALLARHGAEGVRDYWVFNGFAATVDAATLAALAGHPDVESVTLDETITLAEPIPTETGEPLLPSWSLEKVNAPEVWGEYGVRGADVVVGVMDSGVDGEHAALAESWRGNHGDVEASWLPATGENYPLPGDGHGHGTHVTGSILGAPPGEVTGVAPDAEWIAAKIFRDNGSTNDSIIHEAFEWMLAPGGDPANAPDVVNNSWGSDATLDTEFWDDVAAWEAAGIVPVFSNGNNGPGTGTVGSPASFPHAIGIGATDAADRLAWFSSRGPVTWDGVEHQKPQLSAPGYQIRSAWPTDLIAEGYHTISGTSMAAPHVTGAVALMLSAAPGRSVAEIREALTATARGESHMQALPNGYGAGVVDAFAAVTYLTRTGLVTGVVTGPDGNPVPATVSAEAAGETTSADPETGRYALRLPPDAHELTITAYGFGSQTHPVTVTVGGSVTLDAALAAAAEHTLTGVVTGPGGPLSGARVRVADSPVPPSATDPDGRFRLTVAAGSYQLEVAAGGHAPATVPVTVDGDRELPVSLDRLAGSADPGWSQYQNHPARTGHSADSLAGETLQPDWTADVDGPVFFSSPVIADGRVFVNTDDGRLVALDLATGEQQWSFPTSPGMRGAPAAAGGLVYTGGGEAGGIHALDAATGELRWTVPTPGRRTIYTTPAIVDGVVYANTGFTAGQPDTIYALDPQTGAELWSTDLGPRSFLGGAVADGILIAASAGTRTLYGLDAATGEQRWTLERPGEDILTAPSIADGTAYVTTSVPPAGPFQPSFQGSLLAVDAATGELRWEVASHGDGQGTSPAVHGDLVIAGSHGLGVVGAYHRDTGEPAWHYGLPVTGGVSSSVLVSGDGYVVAGAQLDNRVFVLDAASGELVWEQPMGASVLAAPAYAEGRLVVAEQDGTLRAFHPSGQVRGTVTGPDGPVPATVRVLGTDHQTTADPETGQYELSGLPPGEYTVEFAQFGLGTQTRTVQVLVAQAVTVDVPLAPVAEGRVAGTIRDPDGAPLAGATVQISPTPLEPVVTGPGGGYAFEAVSAGDYRVTVDAGGYVAAEQPVTVTAGETSPLDFTLARYHAAVVADFRDRVTDTLTGAGLQVEQLTFAEAADRVADYPVLVLNGNLDDQADEDLDRFAQLVSDADQAGTSLVVLGTSGVSFGSLRSLSLATGDPASHDWHGSTSRGAVWLSDPVAHPLTASLAGGGRIPLLTRGNHDWFDDYSGYPLAAIGNDTDGALGAGIGYQPRTLTSSHVLLASAAATTPSAAPVWEPTVRSLLVDAVRYAGSTAYGAVAGQVTDAAGDPLPATVEVVDGFQHTTAGADGQYRLLLEPGDYTLRIRSLGAQPVELPVTVAEGQTRPADVTLPPLTLGVLAGQVTEEGTDQPVAGASVTVTGRPAVTTGPDGRYVVEELAGGEYRVEVTADGYEPRSVDGVEVTEGEVTTVDVALPRAPGVVVVGDDDGELTSFLEQQSIPVQQADGLEVVEQLDGVEVVILNHLTTDPGEEEFLAALAAFDQAGVSVIFPASGFAFRTRPIHLLAEYTGDPSDVEHIGGSSGDEIFLFQPADHPIFDGIEGDPVPLVGDRGDAATFPDYSGVALGQVGESAEAPGGLGFGYDIRTPDSVHLLLSGLSASFRNHPNGNWTEQARQIFTNAVRWAADPGLGELTGTITDLAGEPIPFTTVEVAGTNWRTPVDPDGSFSLGLPPGEHTVHIQAFGYVSQERTVTVAPDQVVDLSTQLPVGEVGTIRGVVSSQDGNGGIGPGEVGTSSLGGVSVILRGTPYRTVTEPDGSYAFGQIEPGRYDLELETEGHVRTLAEVEVAAGAETVRDVGLRVSPLVGIIDDSTSSSTRDRGKEFLLDWGYRVEEIGWDSLDRIGDLDLVVANRANSGSSTDPGADGLHAFLEAVSRAGVSVIWMDQNGRGAVRFLSEYDGDPAGRGQDTNDGAVVADVLEDHPLTAGLPDEFELLTPGDQYAWFEEFSGTTVANLRTDLGTVGGTIGYRGRTAGAVDVLLSTMSISIWGGPSTRQSPAHRWTPAAERVFLNALAWATDAEGVGADVRGAVTSDRGGRIASQVTVVETGRTYQGRTGDGTFLVPLPAGTWTLRVESFGHQPAIIEVTVEAGQSLALPVTLTPVQTGMVTGTVRGPDGSPVAGAQVRLVDTPLAASTGPDGAYTVDFVPGGDWTVRVTADGFRATQVPVTVATGQVTPVDVTLKATARVAFTDATGSSTHGTALANLIANEGYQVEVFDRDDLDQLADRVAEFDVVVFDAILSFSSHREEFALAVQAAEAAGVSTIYGGQRGSWPLNELTDFRGDPAEEILDNTTVGLDYLPTAAHPIFAGFPVGEPVPLIDSTATSGNQRLSAYAGYSGTSIAHVHGRDGEDFGEAVGYRFTSPTSVEILLASLAASGNDGFPGEGWTANANRIYLNAVAWAVDATQSELTGVVTGAGEPLAGANVSALEAGESTVTGPDGSYQLGLAEGTHTIRVSAFGFAPVQRVVELPADGSVTLDVDLAPLPRGSVAGTVTSAAGGPVAGATVAGIGPVDWTATTGEDGAYAAGDLLEGEYEVTVSADGFLPAAATVTVTAGGAVALDVTLTPTDVGVLGDAGGTLTAYLREAGVPAAELAWDAELDLAGYQVVVVNGGAPDAATFQAVLAAADAAQTSLVFTGTWAVDRGGIRLLERYTDRVTVGAQGFGDGPVQLTGFDPEHPVFAGLGADPATLIVAGGYYSVLDSYVGQPLADLRVSRDGAEPVTGLAAGWDWRTAGSVELLLSASAATEAVGPGLGWTPAGGQLVVDAIAWARDQVMAPPGVPALQVAAPVVLTETVTVRGTADWPSTVTVHRDGQPVATADTGLDGRWSAEVPLLVGDNQLTVTASNLAGGSPVSPPVTVSRWTADWQVRGNWPVHVVTLDIEGPIRFADPADKAELVVLDADGNEVRRAELQWVVGFYLHVLRGLPRGEYTLQAELLVNGQLLVIDGPELN